MSLATGKPNKLNYARIRKVEFPIPEFHFAFIFDSTTVLDHWKLTAQERRIQEWITANLAGRFYLGRTVKLDSTRKIVQVIQIGFEDELELTIFNLSCPHLHK